NHNRLALEGGPVERSPAIKPHMDEGLLPGGMSAEAPFPSRPWRDDPAATSERYWSLFNDPGLHPPDGVSPIPPPVTAEAFQDLSQQVRALASAVQAILPHLPQGTGGPSHHRPGSSPQAHEVPLTAPSSPASRPVLDGAQLLENRGILSEPEAVSSDSA
ncbi:unnamed protein product, partial [Musa textilis]